MKALLIRIKNFLFVVPQDLGTHYFWCTVFATIVGNTVLAIGLKLVSGDPRVFAAAALSAFLTALFMGVVGERADKLANDDGAAREVSKKDVLWSMYGGLPTAITMVVMFFMSGGMK
jgi:hypothetical protein